MMKDPLLRVLLIVTAVCTGLTVLYNLFLRAPFAVSVQYDYPSALDPRADEAFAVGPREDDAFTEPPDPDDIIAEFPLDLNRATAAELELIPGVGPVIAGRIVEYREAIGGYGELEQLLEVKGIGGKMLGRIAPYLYIAEWLTEQTTYSK